MSTSGNAYPGQTPTARELEILHLISLGLDNVAIGAAVHLSENTIKTHVKRLFTKLEVATRAHAVRVGFERGYLTTGGQVRQVVVCGPCSQGPPRVGVLGLCGGHERELWARLWQFLPPLRAGGEVS